MAPRKNGPSKPLDVELVRRFQHWKSAPEYKACYTPVSFLGSYTYLPDESQRIIIYSFIIDLMGNRECFFPFSYVTRLVFNICA